MSATVAFASTPNVSTVAVSATADTGWTTFTNAVTLWTPGASGGKVEEIWFQGIGVTVASMINLIYNDGTTKRLIDQVMFRGVTGSTTASAERFVRQYSNLLVKAGATLMVTSMVASQLVAVSAFGADF